jgi:hypothetical protein
MNDSDFLSVSGLVVERENKKGLDLPSPEVISI